MMPAETHTDRIAAVLASNHGDAREESPMSWQLQPQAGIECEIRLRVTDDWLLYEAGLDAGACNAVDTFLPAQLMLWNASLPGGAKFALNAQFNLTLRAEAALIEDIDPGPRLLEGRAGVETGLARFHGAQETPPSTSIAPAVDLKSLAAETGWTFTERHDGTITFEMPTRDAANMPAELHATAQKAVRVWVRLAPLEKLTEMSRRALAVLLLRAGSVLRLARPAFSSDHGHSSACLEVVFDSAPVGAELTAALESLAVGVGLTAKEATLICQEQTAREYLAVGEWIPREQGDNNNNKQ